MMGEPAAAHLVVQPAILERGETAELTIELPRLREGDPPQRLSVEGAGVDLVASRRQDVLPGGETRFTVRVRADAPPGRLPVVLRAGFPDGETVDVETALVVVPAEGGGGPPLAAIAIGGALAIVLAAGALAVARRRAP